MYKIHPFGIKGNTAFTPKIKKTKEYPSSRIRCIINGMKRIISVEMAPMEGITTAIFRRCYRKWFHGVDREYTPFLVANKNHKFKTREKREFIPFSDSVVPQILTKGIGMPNRTSMTVVMYLNNYLTTSKNYGMAGAVSVVLFIISAALSLVVYSSLSRQYKKPARHRKY